MIKHLLNGLSIRPVSYYKVYKEVAGSTVSGIMLSQLVYWFTATNKDLIYKIDEDWVDELDLSDAEIRGGKSKLKELDFLLIESRGTPAKTHYEIDWDLLAIAIEKGTIGMAEKKALREQKKKDKATNRASKAQECTVPLNSRNKFNKGSEGCSADLTEPVSLNSPNKSSDNDGTLYKTEKNKENTTEMKENSENLHYRYDISVKEVVKRMNLLLKTDYKFKNKYIKNVLKQGFSTEECLEVLNKKYKDWFNTDQEIYLRPSTLFGEKFEEYLNAESKEQRIKREKFAKNLFEKFKNTINIIQDNNLEIKDLTKITSNKKNIYLDDDMTVLNSYSSMELLLSLFMGKELELDLRKRSIHVCK